MPPHSSPELEGSPVPSSSPPSGMGTEARDPERDFAQLAARFSAANGGALSPELSAGLALEILLNQMVEQACLATGATGAAIALRRDREMICRATSGSNAPGLGSAVNLSSGLSAECVRTRRTQRSDDMLTDARADLEASLRVGVRSAMVMPLLRGEEVLGVFELFAPRAFAFGDRDELTLEALAGRTLSLLAVADGECTARPQPPAEEAPDRNHPASPDSAADQTSANNAKKTTRGLDLITFVLGATVFTGAALLVLLAGRQFELLKAKGHVPHIAPQVVVRAPAAAKTKAGANSASKPESAAKAAPPASSSKPRGENSIPPGELRVYENGKEIFRMPAQGGESGTAAADRELGVERAAAVESEPGSKELILSPAAAASSVVYRVEPEYPAEARQQGIQGAVVMQVHIGANGAVEDVRVVSGPPQLMQAAAEAVTRWRFQPHTEDGQPVRMQTQITLNFKLPVE